METWIAQVEHHVQFGTFVILIGWVLKNHSRVREAMRRLNDLWYDHCGLIKAAYQPIENGTTPIVPPKPTWHHGD